jgi:pyridoxal phosphate enzyme (YggS family)
VSALERVRARLKAACARVGRDPAEVTLVAVSKGRSAEVIAAQLLHHGQRVLGESRIQEWQSKAATLPGDLEWHLIGHLQRNKVRFCLPFALIHGVDSWRLAAALSEEGVAQSHRYPILLQVNVSEEASKYGLTSDELPDVVARIADAPGVVLQGLMTIAPYHPDPEQARPHFRRLQQLAERYAHGRTSMGMSGDYEVAIEEGARWVRIGGALFEPDVPAVAT